MISLTPATLAGSHSSTQSMDNKPCRRERRRRRAPGSVMRCQVSSPMAATPALCSWRR
jgi:hypothetical protein